MSKGLGCIGAMVAHPLAFITEKSMPQLVCWSEMDEKYVEQLKDSVEPKLD